MGVFAFACQYIVSLRGQTGNRTVTQMRNPLLAEGRPIACQYIVGACGRCDIVLRSLRHRAVILVATQMSLPPVSLPPV